MPPAPRPLQPYNIIEFVEEYLDLAPGNDPDEDDEDEAADRARRDVHASSFALTGQHPEHYHQAVIQPLNHQLLPNIPYTVQRDYDSLLGFTDRSVLINLPINVFTAPREEETLKSNIHVEVSFQKGPDLFQNLDPSKVPNIGLGKFGEQHGIRVFFPLLAEPDRGNLYLEENELIQLYDDVIYPSARTVMPQSTSDWPAGLRAERFRLRRQQGGFSRSTRIVAAFDVVDFFDEMRRRLNEIPWGRYAKFMWQVRGTKLGQYHANDAESAQAAFEDFTESLLTHTGQWWTDIGIEISHPGQAFLWRTDAHAYLLQSVLNVSEATAAIQTNPGRHGYARDINAHLPAISGCRIDFHDGGIGEFECAYFQMYTTDKSVIYHPEQGRHGKFITASMAMNADKPTCVPQHCVGLMNVYQDAQENIPCNARIEVRVPIQFASTAMVSLSQAAIVRSLLKLPSPWWWAWRILRLQAISTLLSYQITATIEHRLTPRALTLTAGLVWLMNSLHSRPDDTKAGRDIAMCIFPLSNNVDATDNALLMLGLDDGAHNEHEIEDDDGDGIVMVVEDQGKPAWSHGAFFLRTLSVPDDSPCPRLCGGQTLAFTTYQPVFKMDFDSLRRKYDSTRRVPPVPTVVTKRVTSRKGIPGRCTVEAGITLFPELNDLHEVCVQDNGDDNDELHFDHPPATINQLLTKIWYQCWSDWYQKAAVPKNSNLPSYLRLTEDERKDIDLDWMLDDNLATTFRAAFWRQATADEWRRQFGYFFPMPGYSIPPSATGWRSCQYYDSWWDLIRKKVDNDIDRNRVKKALWKKWVELTWIPRASPSRMWDYHPWKAGRRVPEGLKPRTSNNSAPNIFMNPHRGPARFEPEEGLEDDYL